MSNSQHISQKQKKQMIDAYDIAYEINCIEQEILQFAEQHLDEMTKDGFFRKKIVQNVEKLHQAKLLLYQQNILPKSIH